MKNIHILPTTQPSRLAFDMDENFYLLCEEPVFFKHQELVENRSIYITSSEEIKEGVNQWYLDKFLNKPMNSGGAQYGEKQNIIILTTDPTLIEDGVQAIEDDFLKWFVKNSSCEFVEVNKKLVEFPLTFKMMYKIIIPQEEPKQEKEEEYFKHLEKDKKEFAKEWEEIRQEFGFGKKDTLEEAAENYGWRIKKNTFSDRVKANELADSAKQDFIEGANYQAERMYSEEDMRKSFFQGWVTRERFDDQIPDIIYPQGLDYEEKQEYAFNLWFEQFKKK